MANWFFIIIGFAAFLSLEEGPEAKGSPAAFRRMPDKILRASIEIFWQTLVILTAMMVVERFGHTGSEANHRAVMTALAWGGAYYLCRLRRQPLSVFVTGVVFSLFIFDQLAGSDVIEILRGAYVLSFSTALVWFLIAGLKRQILFWDLPPRLRGLPVYLLLLALLSLALSALSFCFSSGTA
ncbi:hypothetical protein N9K06_01720 [Omnitrophica bacterium]|nr:hypothetical protein [Candidatus Omnitrophota bacterium]